MAANDRATYLKERYGKSQSMMNRREQRFVAEMLSMTHQPLAEILDIPCGHGRFTPQLRAAATERLVCGDLRPKHIQALVAAEPDHGTRIETVQTDLFERLPFKDGEFDLVFNFRFLHHVRRDNQRSHLIKELARVSRRYLIVSYYQNAALHAFQKRIWRRPGHSHDLPMVDRAAFLRCIVAHGYQVLDDRGVLPGIHAHRVGLFERT